MSFSAGLVVYFMIWWVVIFMVLPWGVKRDRAPQVGNDRGAPRKSYILVKLIVTTVIATIIWCIIYQVINSIEV